MTEPETLGDLVSRVTAEASTRTAVTFGSPDGAEHRRRAAAAAAWRQAGWTPRAMESLRTFSGDASADAHRPMFARVGETRLDRALDAISAKGGSLVLCGPRGRGKTQLACWLGLRDALLRSDEAEPPYTQRYAVWRRALSEEKRSFATQGESRLAALERHDFVVLDEVQEDLDRDFGRAALTDLIDHRYGAMLRTIVIAACASEALQDLLGTSALSRLNETGLIVHCSWEAYR